MTLRQLLSLWPIALLLVSLPLLAWRGIRIERRLGISANPVEPPANDRTVPTSPKGWVRFGFEAVLSLGVLLLIWFSNTYVAALLVVALCAVLVYRVFRRLIWPLRSKGATTLDILSLVAILAAFAGTLLFVCLSLVADIYRAAKCDSLCY